MMRKFLAIVALLALPGLSPAVAEDGFFGAPTPIGPASGDLSGSYPGPTVAKVNGNVPPTGIWKNNPPVAAVSATDYAPATSGSSVLLGNGAGGFSAYAGGSCTNQAVTAVSAAGALTCSTISNSFLSSATITLGSTAMTLGGTTTSVAGNITWSGNNTYSGQSIYTGATAPASAAGQTVVDGTIASPALTNTGQAFLYNTVANGAILQGDGSSNDILLLNKAGGVICSAATGGTNLICNSISTSNSFTAGVSGSTPGSVVFNNANSGTITVQPPTGALGAAVLTLPDVTGTLAVQAPAWTTYAPTITATSGTFTTVTAAGSFFVSGKSVSFTVTITETAIGTASGKMVLPLPTGTAVRGFVGTCAETASTGKMASYFVATSGNNGNITGYDNATTFIGNGFVVVCSGTYEQT